MKKEKREKKNLTPFIIAGLLVLAIAAVFFVTSMQTDEVIKTQEKAEQPKEISKDSSNIRLLEIKMHDSINKEREKYGYGALKWDDKLAQVARSHSEDMAANDYFAHEDKKGNDYLDRYAKAGYSCVIEVSGYQYNGEENIYLGSLINKTEDVLISGAVDWLMTSKRYRNNIVNIYFKNEGVGIAIKDDKVYMTENFC